MIRIHEQEHFQRVVKCDDTHGDYDKCVQIEHL